MRRWEELRPELDAKGVEIVAVSTDTPEKIRAGRHKHGLQAVMIADHDLSVTDAFGLRNQGAHSGPPGLPGLPVPTTLLADATGTIRWIDQSENYQRRSDPTRVRAALEAQLA